MKKVLLVMVMISMLIAGTAFSQTIIEPTNVENGNGNLNAGPNAPSLAIGDAGEAGINVTTEKPFANIPTTSVPELNFGNGRMTDVSKQLPRIKGAILLRPGDMVTSIIDVTANVPFKKLYKTVLGMAKDHAVQAPYLRFQIIMMDSQKSWTIGGSLIGGGTRILGTTSAAGNGSLIPSLGGTKANPLFTIVAMTVVPE